MQYSRAVLVLVACCDLSMFCLLLVNFLMMMMNSIFNINKRQIQTNSQESASMCRLDKMKNRILIM